MIKFFNRLTYFYLIVYTLIFYYFFITLSIKESFLHIDILPSGKSKFLPHCDYAYNEKKFFTDLKYKKEFSNFSLNGPIEDLVLIDKEYKIMGYKLINYRKNMHTSFTCYLGKKLLHSSLFGSIKLMKL